MTHTYTVEQLESGALRMTCPTCGRVVVIQWEPAYRRAVEVPGDDVLHTFGADALRLIMGADTRQDE